MTEPPDEVWIAMISGLCAVVIDHPTEIHKKYRRVKKCVWNEWNNPDANGQWDTSCINTFTLNAGTPKENEMKFCPFCGGEIEVKS